MQIKHTMYYDGKERKFEGAIVDNDGRKFESDNLDEFVAALDLFQENDYTLDGIDTIQLEDNKPNECGGRCGDCDTCDCDDPCCACCCEEGEEDDVENEDEEPVKFSYDDWEAIELSDDEVIRRIYCPAGTAESYKNSDGFSKFADDIEELPEKGIGVVKTIHIHSIELIALAAAAAGLWKLARKFFRR